MKHWLLAMKSWHRATAIAAGLVGLILFLRCANPYGLRLFEPFPGHEMTAERVDRLDLWHD